MVMIDDDEFPEQPPQPPGRRSVSCWRLPSHQLGSALCGCLFLMLHVLACMLGAAVTNVECASCLLLR